MEKRLCHRPYRQASIWLYVILSLWKRSFSIFRIYFPLTYVNYIYIWGHFQVSVRKINSKLVQNNTPTRNKINIPIHMACTQPHNSFIQLYKWEKEKIMPQNEINHPNTKHSINISTHESMKIYMYISYEKRNISTGTLRLLFVFLSLSVFSFSFCLLLLPLFLSPLGF